MPATVIPEGTLSIRKASKILERDLIKKVLELTKGNRTQSAKILEISRPKLLAKIRAYKLE
jgi:transcriptional regulator with PAS, ATPase and Fis domain